MGNKKKNKDHKAITLIFALVAILLGGVLFIGAISGWFDNPKTTLDPEYYSNDANFIDLNAEEYERLVQAKKSFVVFVDQTSCTTADKLREYITKEMTKYGIVVYHMMFSQVKECSLYDKVKYYPSVVIIKKGKIRAFLRADSDDDAGIYNDYGQFSDWLERYLMVVENF